MGRKALLGKNAFKSCWIPTNYVRWTRFALSTGCQAEQPQSGSCFASGFQWQGPWESQLRALSPAITAYSASAKRANSRVYSYGAF